MDYLLAFAGAFTLSLILSKLFIKLSWRLKLVDQPGGRKKHARATPVMGGLAVFLAALAVWFMGYDYLVLGSLEAHHWLGALVGAVVLVIGGLIDDRFDLPPVWQFIWVVLAALAVIGGGVGIEKVSNPFGGLIFLNEYEWVLFRLGDYTFDWSLIADTFTLLWILGMVFTTKLLDGLDGLVSGVGAIGAFIIFLFTMTTRYYQPDIGFAALVFCGALLGVLVWNWHPAKIFLGESGSLLVGFVLGVLSIISGGKIAIALLIMGIPILDVLWTIVRRIARGKNPFKTADRGHLHFRLSDSGLGVRKTVAVYYGFALIFGSSALFLQSRGKLFSLLTLASIMALIIGVFAWLDKRSKNT